MFILCLTFILQGKTYCCPWEPLAHRKTNPGAPAQLRSKEPGHLEGHHRQEPAFQDTDINFLTSHAPVWVLHIHIFVFARRACANYPSNEGVSLTSETRSQQHA